MSRKTKGQLFNEAIMNVMRAEDLIKDFAEEGFLAFDRRYEELEDFLSSQTITKRPRIKRAWDMVDEFVVLFIYSLAKTDEAAAYDDYEEFIRVVHEHLTAIFAVRGVGGVRSTNPYLHAEIGYNIAGYSSGYEYYMSKHPEKRLAKELIEVAKALEDAGVSDAVKGSALNDVISKYSTIEEYVDVGYLRNLRGGSPFSTIEGEPINDVTIKICDDYLKKAKEIASDGDCGAVLEEKQLTLFD